MDYSNQLNVALTAVYKAQKAIMEIYRSNSYDIQIKEDDSPVTKADLLADQIIKEVLLTSYPDYGILSEETEDNLERLNKEYVWVVDPIDGTKDFIKHTDEFTINIALIYNHQPVVGVIAIPAKDEVYYATLDGGAYFKNKDGAWPIKVSDAEQDLIMLRSRFHFGDKEKAYFDNHFQVTEICEVGSSIKACQIAHGRAHVYPKLGPGTKEWDVAPSAIIVREAGGLFLKPDGSEFYFNRLDVQNTEGFIILNKYNEKLLVK